MALGLSDLLRIKQELGFYGAGGGQRSTGEQIGGALGQVGQGLKSAGEGLYSGNEMMNTALKEAFARKLQPLVEQKAILENAKLGQETTQVPGTPWGPALYKDYGAGTKDLMTPAAKAEKLLSINNLPQQSLDRVLSAGQFKRGDQVGTSEYNALKGDTTFSPYAQVKQTQNILDSLPSRAKTGSLPAQASGVQLAARQLKALIATPGSYQRLGLAKGDVARMVLRAAPQQEVLKDAGFSDTFINTFNVLKQKISSDPSAIDQPLIRKELYDIGVELEGSSRPVLERALNEIERSYKDNLPQEWEKTKSEELGDKFPDIPFQDTDQTQQTNPAKPGPLGKGKYDSYLSGFESSKAAINGLMMQKKMDKASAETAVKEYLSRQ